MPDLGQMEKRQKVLADFGDFALRSDDFDAVLTQACRLVAEALGTGRAKVLEIEHERRTLFVRAGVGWDEGVVGQVRLAMGEHSSETYSIDIGEPVITNDLASEDRFDFPDFIKEAGVQAIANVPIFLPGGRPFGLLQVDASEPRAFGDDDTQFLRTYATILGPIIDRLLKVSALSATEQRLGDALRKSEARQRFLLELGDAMRAQPTAQAIIEGAGRLLAERLNPSRVVFAEFDETDDTFKVFHAWLADGATPFPTVVPQEDFRGSYLDGLHAGRTLRVDDAGEPPFARPDLAALAEVGIKAALSVPLIIGGRLMATLSLHQHTPRRWTDDEVSLLREVAERLWADVIRVRAEAALRESEEKYRTLFESIDEGFCILELIEDDTGTVVDFRYIEANEEHDRQAGLGYVVGKLASEVVPNAEAYWFETFGEVARTGEPKRYENYNQDTAHWYDTYLSRVGGPGSRRVCVVSHDSTERKQAEAALTDEFRNTKILQDLGARLVTEENIQTIYEEVLTAAIEITRAKAGTVQMLDPKTEELVMLATRGFSQRTMDYFHRVDASSHTSCGLALRTGERSTFTFDPGSSDHAVRLHVEDGVLSAQSSPLVSRSGKPIGMVSTHWGEASHRPSERELRFLDLLARQAADLLDQRAAAAALRESEERQAFLLKLADALRPLADPIEVQSEAARVIGEHLGAGRAAYAEIDADDAHFAVRRDYTDGVPSFVGRYPLDSYGDVFWADLRAGLTIRVADAENDARISEAERAPYAAGMVRAAVGVPLVKGGRLAAVFFLHFPEPHPWPAHEVALVEETAERTWAAVERAHAEQALRTSEEKFRSLFSSIDEGLAVVEMIRDDRGEFVDIVFREVNTAFERQTGVSSVVGRSMFDVVPGFEDHWLEPYKRVAATGKPQRVDNYQADLDRWFDVYFSRVDEAGRFVATVFNDVSGRKRAELELRESEERQAFLLKLSDALRAEPDADAVANRAIRMLSEQMRLDRCYLASYRLADDCADITHQVGNDSAPPMPDAIRPSDFPAAFQLVHDRTLVIDDVEGTEGLSDTDRQNMKALGFRALVAPTLREGEGTPLWVMVSDSAHPRSWTPGEIGLAEDVAERTWAAMERARAEGALRQSEATLAADLASAELLRNLAERLVTEENAGAIYDEILLAAVTVAQADAGTFQSYDPQTKSLEIIASKNFSPTITDYFDRVDASSRTACGIAMTTGQRAFVDFPDEVADLRCRLLVGEGLQSAMALPLVSRSGQPLGMLNTHWRERHRPTEERLRFLDLIARQAADLIEQRRAQSVLRESEARLARALEAGELGAWELDLVTHDAWRSPQHDRIFGYETLLPEWTYDMFLDHVVPEDRALVDARFQKAITSGGRWDFECRIRRADGETRWIGAQGRIDPGAEGQPRRMKGMVRDITERREAEERVRASEALLRQFGEASSDVLWIRNAETLQFEYVSPAFEQVYGARVEDVDAGDDLRNWVRLVLPEDRDHALASMRRVFEGERLTFEYRVRRPDGEVRWLRNTDFPMRDNTGRVTRIGGVGHDVTELKQVETRLFGSEERLRLALDIGHLATWDWDMTTGEVVWNDAHYQMQGYKPGEVKPSFETWRQRLHPQDSEATVAAIDEAREHRKEYTREFRNLLPDGTVRWVSARGQFFYDEGGRPTRMIGVMEDVTDRVEAGQALAASETRLRTLTEGIPQLVWRAVDSGRWTWSSPQWSAYTGLSAAQSRDRGWLEAIHPDDHERTMNAWREADKTGVFSVEYRLYHAAENQHRWFSTRAMPVRDDKGGIIEWLGTSTDIDDLRRLQDQQAVMVAELQHRTRNLIAVVRSIAGQTMANTGPTPAFQEQFNDRLEALSRVQGLLSRAEEEPVTLEALVRMELVALGALDSNADRVVLNGPPVRIRHSVVQTLSLALHELATNARKYGALANGEGRLAVTWQITQADGQGRRLHLEWVEQGAPGRIDAVPERRGYGRELIERALPYALGARTVYELRADGVRCTIDMPLEKKERRRRS